MSEWLPIETAPHDDSRRLLIYTPDEFNSVDVGQWCEWGQGFYDVGFDEPLDEATHWMPLPTPP